MGSILDAGSSFLGPSPLGAFLGKSEERREPFSPNIPSPPPPPPPPETAEIELAPAELETAAEDRRRRRIGTQRLQIPLTTSGSSGLGITN